MMVIKLLFHEHFKIIQKSIVHEDNTDYQARKSPEQNLLVNQMEGKDIVTKPHNW